MTFYQALDLYKKLEGTEHLNKVYASMKEDDLSIPAMTALEALKATKTLFTFPRRTKSVDQSVILRESGNATYMIGQYGLALQMYNQALLYAPYNSNAMQLAYSNRSALLLKTKNYSACLKDIETCLKMDCTNDLLDKLVKRKKECQQNVWRDECKYVQAFPEDFFKLDAKRHPQIPCVTTDVKIVIDPETELPKITAAKDIKVGTVIGVEDAFTMMCNPQNLYVSCYYCHKLSLNLKPCVSCCYALFCDDECRKKGSKESHSIECQLIELLEDIYFGPYTRITIKTMLRTKLMCDTWKEFIAASKNIGTERMKSSSINEIFDRSQKFSMLNFIQLRAVKYGSLYNFSFSCAMLINKLMSIPFFFPTDAAEKEEAIKAVARMTMSLILFFHNKIELNNVANSMYNQAIVHIVPNYGYFAFASKLRHCCDANVLPVGLNSKVGLVALHPIKRGDELTISYVDHAYDFMHAPEMSAKQRVVELYRFCQRCRCQACSGAWKKRKDTLNEEQKKFYRKWMAQAVDIMAHGKPILESTCAGLHQLHGLGHTKQHRTLYAKLRTLLVVFQFLATKNYGPAPGTFP